jgi:methanogenic corrinoid protein MtbC1
MWEQRYGFLKPQRTESNIRYYDSKELKRLLNIALLNRFGFRISRINQMSDEEMHEKVLSLTQPFACEERFVTELINAMMEMNLQRFEEVLDNYMLAKGLNKAVQHVIFPFLEKIGLLWVTSHLNPAQEHLVTNIIRQKLIVAIETAYSRTEKGVTFVLFLPEGEYHELGLLYVHYLLKSKGIRTLYLGANMPLDAVASLIRRKQVDYIYVHLTSVVNSFDLNRFVREMHNLFNPLPVIISGSMTRQVNCEELPAHISCKPTLSEAIAFLGSL